MSSRSNEVASSQQSVLARLAYHLGSYLQEPPLRLQTLLLEHERFRQETSW